MSAPTETLPALVNGQSRTPVTVGSRGILITSMDELVRFANAVSKSGLAPKGMDKPETVFVAIQLGLELGLSPMAALQNIGVINGRPGVYGDAALALVENSGLLEHFDEWLEVSPGKRVDDLPAQIPDTAAAVCIAKRKGRKQVKPSRFSVAMAKRASLWGKQGPWLQYPERMLMFRARGFALRDGFPDVLKGLKTTEELQDYADIDQPVNRVADVVKTAPLPAAQTENSPPVPEQKSPEPVAPEQGQAFEGGHEPAPEQADQNESLAVETYISIKEDLEAVTDQLTHHAAVERLNRNRDLLGWDRHQELTQLAGRILDRMKPQRGGRKS